MVLSNRNEEAWAPKREFETFQEGMEEVRSIIERLGATLDQLEDQQRRANGNV